MGGGCNIKVGSKEGRKGIGKNAQQHTEMKKWLITTTTRENARLEHEPQRDARRVSQDEDVGEGDKDSFCLMPCHLSPLFVLVMSSDETVGM